MTSIELEALRARRTERQWRSRGGRRARRAGRVCAREPETQRRSRAGWRVRRTGGRRQRPAEQAHREGDISAPGVRVSQVQSRGGGLRISVTRWRARVSHGRADARRCEGRSVRAHDARRRAPDRAGHPTDEPAGFETGVAGGMAWGIGMRSFVLEFRRDPTCRRADVLTCAERWPGLRRPRGEGPAGHGRQTWRGSRNAAEARGAPAPPPAHVARPSCPKGASRRATSANGAKAERGARAVGRGLLA
jgi:hypothetical protein